MSPLAAIEQAWFVVIAPTEKVIGRPELVVATAMKAGVPKFFSGILAKLIDWFSEPTTIDCVALAVLNAGLPT